ncbi:MAG: efflux RND transporter periplasmic adaptor subunit [Acidobacteria bacterium]|nr:efflux RND transporter periplasmic adaptor subunit [Acidobacteriota bacterium]
MLRGKWVLFGGVTILLAAAAGALQVYRQRVTHRPVAAAVVTQAAGPVASEVSLAGVIDAQSVVKVAAPIEGIVESFGAEAGEDVFEGQLIAHIKNTRLDSAVEAAQLETDRLQARVHELEAAIVAARLEMSRSAADSTRAKGEFDRADRAYQRQQMLYREGATPRLVYEKAQREYQSAKDDFDSKDLLARNAQDRIETLNRDLDAAKKMEQQREQALEQAKQDVASGDVRSPVDGIVLSRQGAAGESVSPQMEDFFRIAAMLSALDVVVQPEPAAVARIQVGQAAEVHVAEVGEAIAGTVREIKDGRVVVDFTSPTPAIRPGSTAQVKIRLGPAK